MMIPNASQITRQRAESSLLYTTAAIWLLRPSNQLKVTHAALFALGTTCFLRPRPKDPSFPKNAIFALIHLSNGYLFWKVKDAFAQIDLWKLKDSLALIDRRTAGIFAAALIWGGLQAGEIFLLSHTDDNVPALDEYRERVERNLCYSALFAMALNSSHPQLATPLLALATTFALRPDDRQKALAIRAAMALVHCVDGYLFSKIAPLLTLKSLGDLRSTLSHLPTASWAAGAAIWYGLRFSSTAVADYRETPAYKLCRRINPNQEGLLWSSKFSLKDDQRHRLEDWIKYGALFAFCMKDGYLTPSTLLITAATTLFLRPDHVAECTASTYPILAAFNFLDGFFFWQALVPLSSLRHLNQLSSQLCLWGAGATLWYGCQAYLHVT